MGLLDLDLDFDRGDLDRFLSGELLFLGEESSCLPFIPVCTPSLSLVEIVVVEILFTTAGLSTLPPFTGERDLLPDRDLTLLPDLESLAGVRERERTGDRDRDRLKGEAVLLVLGNFLSFLNRLSIFLFFWLGLFSFFIREISDCRLLVLF